MLCIAYETFGLYIVSMIKPEIKMTKPTWCKKGNSLLLFL